MPACSRAYRSAIRFLGWGMRVPRSKSATVARPKPPPTYFARKTNIRARRFGSPVM